MLTDAGLHAGQGGKLTDALAYLDHAHRVAPNDPEVYLIRGQVRARANNPAGAVADLRASASLSPGTHFRCDCSRSCTDRSAKRSWPTTPSPKLAPFGHN